MENLEELKKKYEELGKEIERLENQKSNERWKANYGENYYCINEEGDTDLSIDCQYIEDSFRYKTRNYFKTNEEAQRHLDNINTYYDLMDLAEELNCGREIDWNDELQIKYYIFYNFRNNAIESTTACRYKEMGQIYCLNENFLEIALQRIGKERLEKLFKGE